MHFARLAAILALALTVAGCDDGQTEPAEDVVVLDGTSDLVDDTVTTSPPTDTVDAVDAPGCGAEETDCDGVCVDTETAPDHCGGCRLACDDGEQCVEGSCQRCGEDELACGAICVDPRRDDAHCGGCDAACASGSSCVSGRCRAGQRTVSVGATHACRLVAGALECWGNNGALQLGSGASGPLSTAPVAVDALQPDGARWVDVVSTEATSCALLDDGRVQCWGSNLNGELGVDATLERRAAPADIALDDPVAAIFASADTPTFCALVVEEDGDTLHCWGRNAGDVLVEGGSELYRAPRRVALDASIVRIDAVAIGGRHLCVAGRDDQDAASIVCRGDDQWGRTTVPALGGRLDGGVHGLAAGRDHTCAIVDSAHEVVCWGRTHRCQLGASDELSHCATATPGRNVITGSGSLAEVDTLTAAGDATCARVGTALWCWGEGHGGNLGSLGDRPLSHATRTVDALEVARVAMGPASTCLLEVNGTLHCTGQNTHGQLGDGTVSRTGPTPVPMPAGVDPVTVVASRATSCVLASTNQGNEIYCWGDGARGQLGVDPAELDPSTVGAPVAVSTMTASPPLLLAGGDEHLCALSVGEVSCWGANDDGQVAPGAPGAWAPPAVVDTGLMQTPTRVEVGVAHSCVTSGMGQIVCWGEVARGALGDVTTAGPHDMTGSALPAGAVRVVAGEGMTCAAADGGQGAIDTIGCIGQDAEAFDVTLAGDLVVSSGDALVASGDHACALVHDAAAGVDEVQCWGPAEGLRLGDARVSGTLHRSVLTDAVGPVSATSLAVGARHTCASAGARLVCWGDNEARQLGLALDVDTASLTPGGSRPVQSVAAGATHTCVVVGAQPQEREVLCWGTSTHGQLGPAVGRDRAAFAPADFAL